MEISVSEKKIFRKIAECVHSINTSEWTFQNGKVHSFPKNVELFQFLFIFFFYIIVGLYIYKKKSKKLFIYFLNRCYTKYLKKKIKKIPIVFTLSENFEP